MQGVAPVFHPLPPLFSGTSEQTLHRYRRSPGAILLGGFEPPTDGLFLTSPYYRFTLTLTLQYVYSKLIADALPD